MADRKEKRARIRNIKDKTANWEKANPILLDGEIGIEIKPDGSIAIKIGDGETAWKLLKYVTKTMSEADTENQYLQDQINNIVVASSADGGDVSAEVAQARVSIDGTNFATLKDRLDADQNALAIEIGKVETDILSAQEQIDKRIYSKPATSYVSDNTLTLSDVLVDGFYLIDDTWTVTDAPEGISVTALTVQNFRTLHDGTYVKQIAESTGNNGKAFYRFSNSSGSFSQWIELLNPKALSPYLKNDAYLPSGNLNDITNNTFRLLIASQTYENAPTDYPEGFLFVMVSNSWVLQIWYSLNGSSVYKRRRSNSSAWNDWVSIGSDGGGGDNVYNITNEFTFPHYENTYNVTATPTINADTNNYLAPSNDTTDRTNDIVTMLNASGICRLGTGVYYVTDLSMPDNSMIIGSGSGTIIRLTGYDSTVGFAIRMNKNCVVKDLTIEGSATDISKSPDLLNRHGILWEGNANVENASDEFMPERGTIENVIIRYFKGGAITCTNTGTGIINCLNVSNVYIYNCRAGINIAYSSEFHRFTNCHVLGCYYGCINNGGNNIFNSCNFSSNTVGFLIDNSSGQSPNNAHGSAVGCVFNHMGGNSGIGIKIINTVNGFTFVGCQVFYSQIYLEDVSGFNISDSVFGDTNCNITITNGGAIMFNNNQFRSKPTITITNNDKTHWNNNYVRESGQVVTA